MAYAIARSTSVSADGTSAVVFYEVLFTGEDLSNGGSTVGAEVPVRITGADTPAEVRSKIAAAIQAKALDDYQVNVPEQNMIIPAYTRG